MEEDLNNGPREKQWDHIQQAQVKELFNIITSQVYFSNLPYTEEDVSPDLIIKWRVPIEKRIKRSQFKNISAFVSVPPIQLQRAYQLAEKKILHEMNVNHQNSDNKDVGFRLMQSLDDLDPGVKKGSRVVYGTGGGEDIEFMCFDEKNSTLDGFTITFNSMMYMLQRVCGLKVRAFMVNTEVEDKEGILGLVNQFTKVEKLGIDILPKKPVRDIYLFLNLGLENMLKVASRFEVKKEMDYSILDFFLNDPTTEDYRPLKYHSVFKNDQLHKTTVKQISRYFQIREVSEINTDITDETELELIEEQRFESYWEESNLILQFFKERVNEQVSNEEKIYLYNFNRGKINPGCEKIYSKFKKRKQYYDLLKQIGRKYHYHVHDEPDFFQQFVLPSKRSKGGYFHKLKSMLAYKQNVISPFGDMHLFLSMERTKLCYLMIKSTLKVNYLTKLGIDILMLNDDFEKFGKGGDGQLVKGGLGGTYLSATWYMFALFTDIKSVRNYLGDVVAHEILIKIATITYLLVISVPDTVLYIIELLYSNRVYVVTTMLETAMFAISFSIYMLVIEEFQEHFITRYSDKRHSKVFINSYRGPYIRNLVTDELNEFQEDTGIIVFCKNFACLIIFCVLVVVFGAVFYGCRMLLLQIQDPLYAYQSNYISLAHVLSYSLYLVVGDVFKIKLYGKIVRLMVWIQNPSSDQIEAHLRNYLTFYYLLVIQCIPIFFFFILEPFQRNSCYSVSCSNQFSLYIYARFLFNLAMAGLGFVNAVVFSVFKNTLLGAIQKELMHQVEQGNSFHDKLRRMIKQAVQEAERPVYDEGLTKDILCIYAYAFYCSEFSLSAVISLATISTIYVVVRISLLYESRRPINKSQPIIPFSPSCNAIYSIGLIINIWVNTFLLGYIEQYYSFLILWAPSPLTSQSIFLIKLAFSVFLFLVVSLLSIIARQIVLAFSPKSLLRRQENKYKEYLMTVGGPKTGINRPQELTPMKSIFRVYNPDPNDKAVEQQQLAQLEREMKMKMNAEELRDAEQRLKAIRREPNQSGGESNQSNTRLVNGMM